MTWTPLVKVSSWEFFKKTPYCLDYVCFFSFPSNPNIKEKWIDATGHKD